MPEPGPTALIYIPFGVDPAATFAGRSLIERASALARAAELEPYVVRAAGEEAVTGRPDAPCHVVRPDGALPNGAGPIVLMRCDLGCVAGALRDLVRTDVSRLAILDDAARIVLVRTSCDALDGRIPGDVAGAARGAARNPRPGWFGTRRMLALDHAAAGLPPAQAARQQQRAEVALLRSLDNPRDGFLDRLLNRHLSRPMSRALMALPVTPNQVTVVGLLLSFVAAAAIALPGIAWPVLGALLLQFTAVLDCVDGEIARAKVLETEWGEWLDITADTLIHVTTFLGIAVHAWPFLGRETAWLLGGLFALGGLASFVVVTRAEKTEEQWKRSDAWQARLLALLLGTLTTRDTSVLVLIAAATGLLPQLLIGAAFGAQVFWVGTLLLHTTVMRHAS